MDRRRRRRSTGRGTAAMTIGLVIAALLCAVPDRKFNGYAWGENVGYIHFQNASPAYVVQQSGPTAVELVSFTAEPCARPGCVLLRWRTAAEIDTAGFHLWRSREDEGEFARITDAVIPAEGSAAAGESYAYEDTAVDPGVTYLYKLEEIETSGGSAFHGPVTAEPDADARWDVSRAQSSTLGVVGLGVSKGLGVAGMFLPAAAAVFFLRRRRNGR